MQISNFTANINRTLRKVGTSLRKGAINIGAAIDHHLVPRVQYAASRVTEDIAPSIGNAIYSIGNQAAIAAAETVQHGAQVFSSKVLPAIEDKFVEIGNAAVPHINRGIDALESSLQSSVNVISRSTAKGINRLSYKVLGEQRHNRVKNIAINLSGGLNNGINSLANAISNIGNNYDDYSYDLYDYNQDYEYSSKKPSGTVMKNAAYSISKHILGENLTHAMAPIAKTITDAVEKTFPSVDVDDGKIVIDLPGSETDRSEVLRDCTTPYGGPGFCRDLSDCPDLVLDLTNLRKSICFKSFFVPGVCCPKSGNEP